MASSENKTGDMFGEFVADLVQKEEGFANDLANLLNLHQDDELEDLNEFGNNITLLAQKEKVFAANLANLLKKQADIYLHQDDKLVDMKLIGGQLAILSDITHNPLYQALGLRVFANYYGIKHRNFAKTIDLCEAAALIYKELNQDLEWAKTHIVNIYALASLGKIKKAENIFNQAIVILEAYQHFGSAGAMSHNFASVLFEHLGQDLKGLAVLNKAEDYYHRGGEAYKPHLTRVANNKGVIYLNLGQYQTAIDVFNQACKMAQEQGQTLEEIRILQNLGYTYFMMGQFNQGLNLLHQVGEKFHQAECFFDEALVHLDLSTSLLQLQRFQEAERAGEQAYQIFEEQPQKHPLEMAQAKINLAVITIGLSNLANKETLSEKALLAAKKLLAEAKVELTEINHPKAAVVTLEEINLLFLTEDFANCLKIANANRHKFAKHHWHTQTIQATLIAAKAAEKLGDDAQAKDLVEQVVQLTTDHDIPWLSYQVDYLFGRLAEKANDDQKALTHYQHAINQLETLLGQLTIEFRSDFLKNKAFFYEDIVAIYLKQGLTTEALVYVERAKSRALLDLLAFRLDLQIEPKTETDTGLIDKLQANQKELKRLYQHLSKPQQAENTPPHLKTQITKLQDEISLLWGRLNVDRYAREIALWQVHVEPVQPYLPANTLLLEYFRVHNELIVFAVTRDDIVVHHLANPLDAIKKTYEGKLKRNFDMVPAKSETQITRHTNTATGLLQNLYGFLLAPLASTIEKYAHLIIVPHGSGLHHLPFHALHNGSYYLIEKHQFSYLPSSSLLKHCLSVKPATGTPVTFGYKGRKELPHAEKEAIQLAELLQGQTFVGEQATLANLQQAIKQAQLLHISSHGDFKENNPLFSSLDLYDSQLTTFDVFSLRLQTSLVTLSACETGLKTIGGGDEVLGLTRAFLYAGTASLLMSLWRIDDEATLAFMTSFYQTLMTSKTKGEALQQAQCQFLNTLQTDSHLSPRYRHPYYWAPFFLVGDAGPL